jgi:ArsR family transcriptional regulator, arsenate/arsenite/antimonite-responsive transcriptional repressor
MFDYSRIMEITNATTALAALGQPTRLAVFRLLVEAGPEGRKAGEIAEALALPGATLSFHLKELVAAGLIHGETRGRVICYRADFDTMNALIEFLTRNCCGGAPCAPVVAGGCAPQAEAELPPQLA